jgi:hypothetical protein
MRDPTSVSAAEAIAMSSFPGVQTGERDGKVSFSARRVRLRHSRISRYTAFLSDCWENRRLIWRNASPTPPPETACPREAATVAA